MVGEGFDGRIADAGSAEGGQVVADRVEEMCLPKAWRRVEEERVVGLSGELGDSQRRGVGHPVPVSDDELLEAVARVEAGERAVVLERARGYFCRLGLSTSDRHLDLLAEHGRGASLQHG